MKTAFGLSKDQFVIPEGFVETGETLEKVMTPEKKEETNFEIVHLSKE